MRPLVAALLAAMLLAGTTAYQVTSYAESRPAPDTYAAWVAQETGCGDLRLAWTQELSVWKGGVRDGHDAMVEPHLDAMRAILRRLQALDDQGVCGG